MIRATVINCLLLFSSDRTAPNCLIETAPTIVFNWIFPIKSWYLSVFNIELDWHPSKTMSILEAPEDIVAKNVKMLSANLLYVKRM